MAEKTNSPSAGLKRNIFLPQMILFYPLHAKTIRLPRQLSFRQNLKNEKVSAAIVISSAGF